MRMKKLLSLLSVVVLLAVPTIARAQQVTSLFANENAPLTAPTNTAVGSGGSCTAGAHTVAVTIAGNYLGQAYETGLSSGATATCVASDSLTIAAIPVGSGYALTRNIYISKAGTTGPLYYAQTVADNTSTSATFVLADANLGAPWKAAATPPMMQMFRVLGTELQPVFDNSIALGDATHRAKITQPLISGAALSSGNYIGYPAVTASGASTVTLTAAQCGQAFAFDSAAGIIYKLPATFPPAGCTYDFYVTVSVTSNAHEIETNNAANFFGGAPLLVAAAATAVFACNGSSHIAYKTTGTTTGGLIGTHIRVTILSATLAWLDGINAGSGTLATPCSATN